MNAATNSPRAATPPRSRSHAVMSAPGGAARREQPGDLRPASGCGIAARSISPASLAAASPGRPRGEHRRVVALVGLLRPGGRPIPQPASSSRRPGPGSRGAAEAPGDRYGRLMERSSLAAPPPPIPETRVLSERRPRSLGALSPSGDGPARPGSPERVMADHPRVGLAWRRGVRCVRHEPRSPLTPGRVVVQRRHRLLPRDRRDRGGGGDARRRGRRARPVRPGGRRRAGSGRGHRAAGARPRPRRRLHAVLRATSGSACCSSSPATRSTSRASAASRCAWRSTAGPCRWRSPTRSAALLAAAGVVISLVYVGSALATTAIGTLILPILSDTGEMQTRFGTYLLAAGAVGEFGPILLLTLVLSTQSALHNALILIAFVAARRGRRRGRGPLVGAHDPAVRADDREELAARGPLDRRARLRAGAARLRPRARPPARRVRRRPDHAAGAPEAGGRRCSTRSSPPSRSASSSRSSSS